MASLYLLENRETKNEYFEILKKEFSENKLVPMVCKLAYLKNASRGRMDEDIQLLKKIFKEAVFEGLIFPFFSDCPSKWLREMGLSDKVILMHRGSENKEVSIYTSITKENEDPVEFEKKILSPMWKNQFTVAFTVYVGEKITWYFEDDGKKSKLKSFTKRCGSDSGKYSALSSIRVAPENEKERLLNDYYVEERLAEHFFMKDFR